MTMGIECFLSLRKLRNQPISSAKGEPKEITAGRGTPMEDSRSGA